jgi:hypothetical protein
VSAYLERLATSTRHPPAGVTPLTRPLYLQPQAAPEPAAKVPDQPPAAAGGGGLALPAEPRAPAGPPTPAPLADFEPLLPGQAEEAPSRGDVETTSEPHEVKVLPEAPRRAFSRSPLAAPQGSQRLPAEQREPQRTQLGRVGPVVRTSRPVGTSMSVARASARPLAAASGAESAPEEIRIHIGRVEVVAAGPPAAQPARPAQRRERTSLRLDEYLGKGG